MNNVMLSDSQKKSILQKFSELDMHKELKILFEKMYPRDTSVYITHGKDEMGRDLIISKCDPLGTENTAVVVKMDNLSGSATDKKVQEVIFQINQCFQTEKTVNDQFKALETNKVVACIFGNISNKVENNIFANTKMYERKVQLLDLQYLMNLFTKYYSNIFIGASGLEALHNKYNELEEKVLSKNKHLKTSFIEPNLRMFKKSKKELLAISRNSDEKKFRKTIGDNIFGEKETIQSIAKKTLTYPQKILIEGEAGSGKTIFVLKLTMHIIRETIKEIEITKSNEGCEIQTPIVIRATLLNNGKNLKDILDEYYSESSIALKTKLLIIDGIDEVDNTTKERIIKQAEPYCFENMISLIFTTRKSTEVKTRLVNYDKYELLPFETSQAINYVKSMIQKNQKLLNALIKGLEQLRHQIPLYPMSLSLLIDIAETQQEVPASISELYKKYIDMVLSQYDDDGVHINVIFEPSIKKDFLENISYKLFYKNNLSMLKRIDFDQFVDEYIKRFPTINDKDAFLEDLERTSLIKIDEKVVEFLHKSFLDYFLASYFKNRQTELHEDNMFEEIYELYHNSQWEDVTYFYFGQKTRINKKEIRKILDSEPSTHSSFLKNISQFMIGKLMQFAWHTEFEDKKYAIQLGVSNVLELRSQLIETAEQDIEMELPKILGDVQMLHFVDESYSSRFLVEEVKSLIDDMFKGDIKENTNMYYFSAIYMLENISMIENDYLLEYFNKFMDVHAKLPPDISLPLINILSLYIKNEKINAPSEQVEKLRVINRKLKKKYSDITADYFSFKTKLDQLRLQKIASKAFKNRKNK